MLRVMSKIKIKSKTTKGIIISLLDKLAYFFDNIGNWFYDGMGYVETGFKIILKVAFGLLIAAGILYALYWIGKAIIGFIKHYSQFA